MRHPAILLLCLFSGLVSPAAAQTSSPEAPDACDWTYAGSNRKDVKLRSAADGAGYTLFNGGAPITLDQWFNLTCSLDGKVARPIPDTPIPDAETIKLTLRAYLLAARFERNGDHDIHFELGAVPGWDTDHVIVELPPLPEVCKARQLLWGLVAQDEITAKGKVEGDVWVLKKPVPVLVTGFVFLDGHHAPKGSTDFCHPNGGRGIELDAKGEAQQKGGTESLAAVEAPAGSLLAVSAISAGSGDAKPKPGANSKVRGLWELHPVLEVQVDGGAPAAGAAPAPTPAPAPVKKKRTRRRKTGT